MVAHQSSAVRQSVMAVAIGLAIYAQLTVHQQPDDTLSWLFLAFTMLLAAVVAGPRPLPEAAVAVAPRAGLPALRVGLAAAAVAAIALTTYWSTTRQHPVLALLLWLASPIVASFAVRGWQITPGAAARHAVERAASASRSPPSSALAALAAHAVDRQPAARILRR